LESFKELPGGWHMVVMEMIWGGLLSSDGFFPLVIPIVAISSRRLTSIHQAGYVHGDVCVTQTFMVEEGWQPEIQAGIF